MEGLAVIASELNGTQPRTLESLREQYLIEKELANRLRNASRDERRGLYSVVYDELFRRVPLHPQLTRKSSPEESSRAVTAQMRFLGRFLRPDQTFVEIGAGDCALSLAVAKRVKKVFAIDVSASISDRSKTPRNFRLLISDGFDIAVPPGSVNVAYSNQVMEHLHPDDVNEQLQNIYKALVPGGSYVCITPNRLNGPFDISRHFDRVATGFHMREYTVTELSDLFTRMGFSNVKAYLGLKGRFFQFPLSAYKACEAALGLLPFSLRRALTSILPFRLLIDIRLVAVK